MGNTVQRVDDDDEVSEHEGVYDVRKIYWDGDGNLRHGVTERNRDNEIIKLLQADTKDESDMTKLWMIVPSRWIRMWLLFAHLKLLGDPPGPVDMLSLLKKDASVPGGWRPKKNLLAPSTKFGEERPGHYRRISLEAWLHIVELYGLDGYAIAVRGFPYDDISRWRVFKDPRSIDINLLPEPVLPTEEDKKKAETGSGDLLKSMGLGGLFGGGKGKKEEPKAGAAAAATSTTAAAAKK